MTTSYPYIFFCPTKAQSHTLRRPTDPSRLKKGHVASELADMAEATKIDKSRDSQMGVKRGPILNGKAATSRE